MTVNELIEQLKNLPKNWNTAVFLRSLTNIIGFWLTALL